MHMNFLTETGVSVVSAAVATGTSTVTTATVDMRGFDSVVFVAMLGDVVDTSELTLTAQGGDESDGSDAADYPLAQATFTADATSADSKIIAVDLHKPNHQYVRATLDRVTAAAVVNGILAIRYNTHENPLDVTADIVASVFVNDPNVA